MELNKNSKIPPSNRPEECKPKWDRHWRKKLTKTIHDVEESESRFLEFADIKDLPPIFMELLSEQETPKIRFRGAKVYVRGNETPVHIDTIRCLASDILTSSFGTNNNLHTASSNFFIVVNKFSCGTLTKKIPDALFVSENGIDPKVSLEVSFSHENTNELYLESVHALTEYTTIEYSFAVKVYQSAANNDFHALFFAMKRAPGNPPADPEGLPAEVEKIYYPSDEEEEGGIQEGFDCVHVEDEEGKMRRQFPVNDVEAQKAGYGVEVFFTREIDEDNFHRTIAVRVAPREKITILARSIYAIRNSYRYWWRMRHEGHAAG